MSNKVNVSGGIGFPGLLAILFIGLKLTGYINWPWIWVLSPLWLGTAFLLAIVAMFVVVFAIVGAVARAVSK